MSTNLATLRRKKSHPDEIDEIKLLGGREKRTSRMVSTAGDIIRETVSLVMSHPHPFIQTLECNIQLWRNTTTKVLSLTTVNYGHALNVCLLTRTAWANYVKVFAMNPQVCLQYKTDLDQGFQNTISVLNEAVSNFAPNEELNKRRVIEYHDNVLARDRASKAAHKSGINGLLGELARRASQFASFASSIKTPWTALLQKEWASDPQMFAVGDIMQKAFLLLRCGGLNLGMELLQERGPAHASVKSQIENAKAFVVNPCHELQKAVKALYPGVVSAKNVKSRLQDLTALVERFNSDVIDKLEAVRRMKPDEEDEAKAEMQKLGKTAVKISMEAHGT